MKPNSASTDPAPLPRSRVAGSLRALALGLAVVLASDSVRAAQVPAGGGQPSTSAGQDPTPGVKGVAPAKPAPDAAAIAAAKAAETARLKAEFDRIASDLRTAVAGFQAEISGLQQKGVPREQWPPHPNIPYYSRFEELAFQDQPDALRWCLAALGQIGITATEVAERKAEIYARLVVIHPDLPWMSDVARWIQSDGAPGGIGFERADDLLRALADGTTVKATRASALAARSALLSARTDPASLAENEKIVRELAEKHADTQAGANAKGRLFQAQFLVPGRTPPEVQAVDTEGKPLRLADYRGKVVVLDFWGFWCGVCVRNLPHLKELVKLHENDPFALVGIATDPDLAEFQRKARDNGVTWRNAWTGGTMGTWPTSWGVQRYPTVYVLDAQGVVRFVDVRGEDLSRAVKTLLDEMRAAKTPTPR